MLYGGLAAGAVGCAKGIYNYCKANTAVEEEKARQEVCGGFITGTLSAIGLRGIGKAAGAASTAKNRTGFFGKMIQNTSQFSRDITVNTYRATKNSVSADIAAVRSTGFVKTYGNKLVSTYMSTDFGKKYNDKYNQMETSLNNKLSEINTKLAAETNPAKKALLQEQKKMFENNLTELRSVSGFKTKSEFDKLKTENSGTQNREQLSSYTQTEHGYEINGQQIAQKRFNTFKKEMDTAQKQYNKDINNLAKSKEGIMRTYAKKTDIHKAELDEYTQAAIRNKYNTSEKLKAGIESLSQKISDTDIKIADVEAKISRATNSRKIANLNRQLNTLKRTKSVYENELSVCSQIKFKSVLKPSTWGQNETIMFIGGNNAGTSFEIIGSALKSPVFITPLAVSQWDREYTAPLLGGDIVELTAEKTKEYLDSFEQQKAALKKHLETLDKIQTTEEFQNYINQQQTNEQTQQQDTEQQKPEPQESKKDDKKA